MNQFRSFAIVPAAGFSRRMAQPKLLLNWGGQTLIERVLTSWTASLVTRVVIVVHTGHHHLAELCRSFDVDVVIPSTPPQEMKHSVHAALRHVEINYRPAQRDAWLLSPADLPQLSPRVIDQVIAAYDECQPKIISPTYCGRRGHPVLLPWTYAARVGLLNPSEGVDALMQIGPVQEIVCDDAAIIEDVDTLADYDRLAQAGDT